MDILLLKFPAKEYADQIWSYRQAFLDAGDSMDGCGWLKESESPEASIDKCALFRDESTVQQGFVPSNTYLAVRQWDDRVVGMIDLRRSIDNPVLRVWGGHIGYSVHPAERRKGYAKRMLHLCLEKCRELGLEKVMVTCNEGNIGSERTILANGGVYECSVEVNGATIKRFWILLN